MARERRERRSSHQAARTTQKGAEQEMSPSHYRGTYREAGAHTLAVVMAGGSGTRLGELTRWHSKPALPFGGQYRNIDFPLSNCVNSGLRQIAVLTQYKAHSLIQHLTQGWSFLRPELNEYHALRPAPPRKIPRWTDRPVLAVNPHNETIVLWPAKKRRGQRWSAGPADAVYQNVDLIMERAPAYVLVLAGDHVYKMDYRQMVDAHAASGAKATVGCVEVPIAEARAFGIMGVNADGWVEEFQEKPEVPKAMPGRPKAALGSMGIYVFNRDFLFEALIDDASNPSSGHDFGRDLLPKMVAQGAVRAHAFRDIYTGEQPYWRDVGTVDSYWQANMDLLDDEPALDLHDDAWPIRTHQPPRSPTRFVREGVATRS